ncbi:outer membrane protein, partial [Helicobacter pylori]
DVGINPNSVYATGKLNAKVNHTIFQFLVNVGIRTNIFEHHGIEFGIKIPTLPNHFFKGSTTIRAKKQGPLENGQPTTITGAETNFSLTQTLRRQYSMYLRYVYTF